MQHGQKIGVLIPALNEEAAIGPVVSGVPAWADRILVVDNGSQDNTAAAARASGAAVVREAERGYGAACLTGLKHLEDMDIIVFLDGDYSDYPEDMAALVGPIVSGASDFVVGSRVLGAREKGALTPQQRFGNWLACRLIRLIWGVRYTDLGPFRAIRASGLRRLNMRDRNYGWTVEMQIKAAQAGLRISETPVRYRKRIGKSKVSGTVKGTVLAGYKILATIARFAVRPEALRAPAAK